MLIDNQTAKSDAGKPRLTLVPRRIIWAIARIREYGFGYERLSRIYQQIDAIRTEYNLDGDKLRKAAWDEVGVDVYDIYTRPREVKSVV